MRIAYYKYKKLNKYCFKHYKFDEEKRSVGINIVYIINRYLTIKICNASSPFDKGKKFKSLFILIMF